jgi:TolB-like protein/Tfp pilus assembly protein PilF
LDQYYANDGKSDPILIAYQPGGYVPQVSVRQGEVSAPAPPASIAVLPFAEASENQNEAYFGEGLAEELIHGLSRIAALKVVARTSAFQFRGSGADVREIGRRLGVQTVMEGSIRRQGDQLRLSVRLVSAADGFTVWSSVYERKSDDVFAMQAELAQAIITTLEPRLGTGLGGVPRGRLPIDAVSHDLYLRGRHQWNQLGPESLNRAIEYFRRAIAHDPTYAPAHAGLADCYIALAYSGYAPPNHVMPKAKAAAAEAIALDPALGEAHTSLAKITEDYEWRVSEAESIYQRALELNPGYATAHYWYGMYLFSSKRLADALREIRMAQELDPISPMINWAAGMIFEIQGRQEEALEQYRRADDLIPRNPDTLRYLLLGAARKGRYSDAEHVLRGSDLSSDDVVSQIIRAGIHGAHGRIDKGLQLLQRVEQRAASEYVPPVQVSTACLMLGQGDRALKWLQEAFVQRDGQLLSLDSDPLFAPLRAHPGYQDLLKRIAEAKA